MALAGFEWSHGPWAELGYALAYASPFWLEVG